MVDIQDFKMQMSGDQWEAIMASENRLEKFFTLWTQKEAVIKADGRGLAIPLHEIIMEGEKAFLANNIWDVKEVRIADGYCCHLATNGENPKVCIKKIFMRPVIL
jgi:4'-phosphopantetheinyl transferase